MGRVIFRTDEAEAGCLRVTQMPGYKTQIPASLRLFKYKDPVSKRMSHLMMRNKDDNNKERKQRSIIL